MCKCAICHKSSKDAIYNKIRLSEDDGFCSSIFDIEICDNCMDNTFVNSYGFEFIYYNKQVYIRHQFTGCYEMARSKKDIDAAFDPERAMFNKWIESQ